MEFLWRYMWNRHKWASPCGFDPPRADIKIGVLIRRRESGCAIMKMKLLHVVLSRYMHYRIGNQHMHESRLLHRLQRLMNNYGRDQVTNWLSAHQALEFPPSRGPCELFICAGILMKSDILLDAGVHFSALPVASCHTTFSELQGNRALFSFLIFVLSRNSKKPTSIGWQLPGWFHAIIFRPSWASIQHGSGFSLTLLTLGLVDWFVFAGRVVKLKLLVQHWGICTWQTPKHAKSRFTR